MNYSVTENVHESWLPLVDAFLACIKIDLSNNGVPISDLVFDERRNRLHIQYSGGSKLTDAYALMAAELSTKICVNCNRLATATVFGFPVCDDHR